MVDMAEYFRRLQQAAAKDQKAASNGHGSQDNHPPRRKNKSPSEAENFPDHPS